MFISTKQLRTVIRLYLMEVKNPLRKQLAMYLNKGYFMTFSDLLKVGINPKSSFGTPVGVYAYPVTDAMLDWYEQDIQEDEDDPTPIDLSNPKRAMFASNRKYVHILSIRNSANIVDNEISAHRALEIANLMNVVVGLPKIDKIEYDDSDETIYGSEYVSVKTPMGWLWKYSHKLRSSSSLKTNDGKTSDTFAWNKLWRAAGIDGVVDRGERIIHVHEPAQAVFFSARGYEHIDTFEQKLKPEDQEAADRKEMIDKVDRSSGLQFKKLYRKADPKNSVGIAAIIKIATNINAPVDLLDQMIDDGYGQYVAINLKLPLQLQLKIASNHDNYAKTMLASNTSLDISVFEKLSKGKLQHMALAMNNSCPPSILRRLASSDDKKVLIQLTCNPNTPDDVIVSLTQSDDAKVKEYAVAYQKIRGL